jgi:hypothetical protein
MRVAKAEEVKVIRVQEGESGVREGRLTDERIDILSDYFSRSQAERNNIPLSQLASIAGLSVAAVRHAQRDARVLKKVKEQAEIEATYDAIEARAFLRGVMESAKQGLAPISEGVKAARTQLELSGDLKKGGASVNVVNQNVQPVAFMDVTDEDLIERVEQILGRRQEPDDE